MSRIPLSWVLQTQFAEAFLDGKVNLWAPYFFTYHIGRADFVLPTFRKAEEHDSVAEFFKTLHLNPFSQSSATWKTAFDWL